MHMADVKETTDVFHRIDPNYAQYRHRNADTMHALNQGDHQVALRCQQPPTAWEIMNKREKLAKENHRCPQTRWMLVSPRAGQVRAACARQGRVGQETFLSVLTASCHASQTPPWLLQTAATKGMTAVFHRDEPTGAAPRTGQLLQCSDCTACFGAMHFLLGARSSGAARPCNALPASISSDFLQQSYADALR